MFARSTVSPSMSIDDPYGDAEAQPTSGPATGKRKLKRGSRACLACRKLKMTCVPLEGDTVCKRCRNGGKECIFEASRRGKGNSKQERLARAQKNLDAMVEKALTTLPDPNYLVSSSRSLSDSKPIPPVPGPSGSRPSPGSSSFDGQQGASVDGAAKSVSTGVSPGGGEEGGERTSATVRNNWTGAKHFSEVDHNALNPLGLLAEASLKKNKSTVPVSMSEILESVANPDEQAVKPPSQRGPGNPAYFQTGPLSILSLRRIVFEQRMPPQLLKEKTISEAEAAELFDLFFDKAHRHAPVLSRKIHTSKDTGSRSPFLFTVICTIASRYYRKRTDKLYRKCLVALRNITFEIMNKGYKSIEVVQGFLLLSTWGYPAERFEYESSYQFAGIAIRMALDLNIHVKTRTNGVFNENVEEECRNRERTWLYAFVCDRRVAMQMGKPTTMPSDNFIVRGCRSWFREAMTQPSDRDLCAQVALLRIGGRVTETLYSDPESISGLNTNLDYAAMMHVFLGLLDDWLADWSPEPAGPSDPVSGLMREFYWSYYRLFVLSFAVQQALDNPSTTLDLNTFCLLCYESARTMICIARDALDPQGILRYATDVTFVYLSYAAAFLRKLLASAAFKTLVDGQAVMRLMEDLISTMRRSAVDEYHTPALYATFLQTLVESKPSSGQESPTRAPSPVPHSQPDWIADLVTADPQHIFSAPSLGLEIALDADAPYSLAAAGENFWDTMLMPGFGGSLETFHVGFDAAETGVPHAGPSLSNLLASDLPQGDPWSSFSFEGGL